MKTARALRLIIPVLLVVAVCLGICSCRSSEYLIKWLPSNDSFLGDPVRVMVYNTKTGKKYGTSADYRDSVYRPWPTRNTEYDLWQLKPAAEIISSYPPNAIVGQKPEAQHPGRGLQSLKCRIIKLVPRENDPPTYEILEEFLCLLDRATDKLTYIDKRPPPTSSDFGRNVSAFDHKGDYLYYTNYVNALRYEIDSGRIDTIPGGDLPLIPWNREMIAVYSRNDHTFRLLGEGLEIVAEAKGEVIQYSVISACSIDDSTLAVGVYTPPSMFKYLQGYRAWGMRIVIVDFRTGKAQVVHEIKTGGGQIMGVERIP